MTRLVIVLPFQRPPLRPNQRVHPHARADLTRLVRHAATQCAKAAHIPPQPRSAVTAAWFPPDRRRRDVSSLHMLSKAAIENRPHNEAKTMSDLVKSDVAAGATNTIRPLTHSLEQARRG